MSKKQPKTLKNFWYYEPKAVSFDLNKVYDEENEVDLYIVSVMFHLDVEEDGGNVTTNEAIIMQTGVYDEDKNTALKMAVEGIVGVFDCDVLSKVSVFNSDGETIEEFDMNDILDGGNANPPVDKEFDLENMPVGVPLIRH